MVKVVINGKDYEFEEGLTILEACKEIGIEIPTFCYDERIAATSSCRICVVEEVNWGQLVTACSMALSDGMKIETNSDWVVESRKELLDLLFSNHPNDCLTCQASGKCKLQDYCYEYGVTDGTMRREGDNDLEIDETNPFYTFDPNKCILCGKCVRTCSHLQVTNAITYQGRGFDTKVSAPFDLGVDNSTCVSCGNCVAVCPTGALIPRSITPYRHWEVQKTRTTCPYCAVGCQLNLLTKDGVVVGAEPYMVGEGKGVEPNDGMLCVKGRFAYNFINHPDRLRTPLIKRDGVFEEATWEEALSLVAEKLSRIKEEHGPDAIGGFSCARSPNEDNYIFQKFIRTAIGTNNVDHCARV